MLCAHLLRRSEAQVASARTTEHGGADEDLTGVMWWYGEVALDAQNASSQW